jgi:16S rRNA (adenine(1408)-N(1))-methyltransferase
MIQIKGNKKINLEDEKLLDHAEDYEEVILDMGTGDGRFVYKSALENPSKLYVGIDPAEKQMELFSKKATRKKVYNAMFIVGSIEMLPFKLNNFADKIYVILPWGSLLKNIIEPDQNNIKKVSGLLKPEGNLQIIFGYNPRFEPSESQRLNLPEINDELIHQNIVPKIEEYGNLSLQQQNTLTKNELFNFETTWSKKLTFGAERPLFQLIFKRC